MTGTLTLTGGSSNLIVGGTGGFTGALSTSSNLTVNGNITAGVFGWNTSNQTLSIARGSVGTALDIEGTLRLDAKWNDSGAQLNIGCTSNGYGKVAVYGLHILTGANNSRSQKFIFTNDGKLGVGVTNNTVNYTLDVRGSIGADTSITIGDASGNSGAPIIFAGSSGYKNFRIGNQVAGNDLFEITPSTTNGGTTFTLATVAGLLMDGSGNTAIGLTSVDATYKLEVGGNINFTGTLYQDGSPFVTSRWTETANGTDIYRGSKVGINRANNTDLTYDLDVTGTVGMTGILYANGDKQWLDTYGVFKANRNTIGENVTIPQNTNAMTAGPITINNNYTITIADGASWSIV